MMASPFSCVCWMIVPPIDPFVAGTQFGYRIIKSIMANRTWETRRRIRSGFCLWRVVLSPKTKHSEPKIANCRIAISPASAISISQITDGRGYERHAIAISGTCTWSFGWTWWWRFRQGGDKSEKESRTRTQINISSYRIDLIWHFRRRDQEHEQRERGTKHTLGDSIFHLCPCRFGFPGAKPIPSKYNKWKWFDLEFGLSTKLNIKQICVVYIKKKTQYNLCQTALKDDSDTMPLNSNTRTHQKPPESVRRERAKKIKQAS